MLVSVEPNVTSRILRLRAGPGTFLLSQRVKECGMSDTQTRTSPHTYNLGEVVGDGIENRYPAILKEIWRIAP